MVIRIPRVPVGNVHVGDQDTVVGAEPLRDWFGNEVHPKLAAFLRGQGERQPGRNQYGDSRVQAGGDVPSSDRSAALGDMKYSLINEYLGQLIIKQTNNISQPLYLTSTYGY